MKPNGLFRIASFQFGYAMYAASIAGSVDGREAPQWSDRVGESHLYDHRDARETKLSYWKAYAESCGLDASAVRVVEVV